MTLNDFKMFSFSSIFETSEIKKSWKNDFVVVFRDKKRQREDYNFSFKNKQIATKYSFKSCLSCLSERINRLNKQLIYEVYF